VSVDFVVELPNAHGYNTVMNMVDCIRKHMHFIPTNTKVTAEGTTCLYLKEVWKHHGLPCSIISDRGSQFVGEFTCELYCLLGIELAPSTTYHPQTDGQAKHVNQEMEQYICIFTNECQDDWDELLPLSKFTYNNHIHSLMQQTPFMVDTGRHPQMGFEPQEPCSEVVEVNEFAEKMAKGLEEAKAALTKAKDEYKQYYDRRRTPAPIFKLGDMAWLDHSNIKTTHPSAKFGHHQLGPFEVEEKIGPSSYRIKLPLGLSRLHNVFPVIKLSLTKPDPFPGRVPPPPPPAKLIDGEEEFEVEKILDNRIQYHRLEYLIQWKGYYASHNSWSIHYNIHAPDAIAEFYLRHPRAPRQINAAFFDSIPFLHADASTWWRSECQGNVL
jgi:hypothetical protein